MQYDLFNGSDPMQPPPRHGGEEPSAIGAVRPRLRSIRSAREGEATPELRPPAPTCRDRGATHDDHFKAGEPLGVKEALGRNDQTEVVRLINTLADAVAWLDDAVCDHPRRAQLRSSLKTVGRVLGRPLDRISANPESLRADFADACPAKVGLKQRSWVGAKSSAHAALRAAGAEIVPGRDSSPVSGDWEELLTRLPERRYRIGLSRLLRFLTRNGVTPNTVTPDALVAFAKELHDHCLRSSPDRAYRNAVRLWNAAAECEPSWPQIHIDAPADPRRYSLEWEHFHRDFTREVTAFLSSRTDTDPPSDDYCRPVRAATADGRRRALRQLASALVLSGRVSIVQLTNLATLTEIENVRAALTYLRDERSGGKLTESHTNMVWLLRTIARHWLKDESRTDELKALLGTLKSHLSGGAHRGDLRPRNRARLRQFNVSKNAEALFSLPLRVLKATEQLDAPTHLSSVRIMQALQAGMLTYVPMRLKNLTALRLGENLIETGHGANRRFRIYLASDETKTSCHYEAPLPRLLYPLLDSWLQIHRQRICSAPSPYLFPNARGELRSKDALSSKLAAFVRRETGLVVHAHLFRHISAKLYLDYDPAGIEIVRQVLGHASTATTLKAYADLQTDPAFKRLEEALMHAGYRRPKRKPPKGGAR